MSLSPSDVILLTHAGFGICGCLAALWVFVETLNARPENAARIRTFSLATALFIAAAGVCGGYFYLRYYPADKALILKGPWPFAHNIFMETKEHLFFITLILAFLLPLAARERLDANPGARRLALSVAALVAITGLALEGAGGVIDHGVKLSLLHAAKGVAP